MALFDILFDATPGFISGSPSLAIKTEENGKIPLSQVPTPDSREGYIFRGWSEQTKTLPGLHFPITFNPTIDFPSEGADVVQIVDFSTKVFTESTTLYAVWEEKEETTVYFYLNNTLYYSTVPNQDGMVPNPPIAPELPGKIFVGWTYANSPTTLVDFETAVFNESERLWGVYGIKVAVIFDASPGSFEESQTVTEWTDIYGIVKAPETPYRGIDWELAYWYLDDPDIPIDLSTTVFEENTTLYAKWTKLESRVIFDPNGGNWNGDDTPKVIPLGTNNKPVQIPVDPTRNATEKNFYEFLGWTTVQDDLDTIIYDIYEFTTDESTTLYAYWRVLVLVTIDANGGLFSVPDELPEVGEDEEPPEPTYSETDILKYEVIAGETLGDIEIPDISKPNASFDYWSYDISGNNRLEEALIEIVWEENTTVYAIWRNIYQVKFDANGGSFQTGTIQFATALDGEFAIPPDSPSRPNAKFVGWALDSDAEKEDVIDVTTMPITENTTFYAVWEKVITVLFNAGEGAFVNGEAHVSREAVLGYVEAPINPAREGWEFRGWSKDPEAPLGSQINVATTEFTKDTVLYAIWKYVVYVTFNQNGGSFLPGTQTVIRADDDGYVKAPSNEPTRDGYIFKGWGFVPDATEPINLKTQTFEEQTILYAVWKLIVYVTFNANGGAFPDGREAIVVQANEVGYLEAPQDPVRNGHKFIGWGDHKDSAPSQAIDIPNTSFDSLITLYAIWERIFVSTIEFGFYDSLNGDRRYDAKDIASIFDGIIFDGISATNNNYYQVEPMSSGLRVLVKSGKAWFDHTYSINTADIMLQLAAANATYTRYDAIVLEVNRETRINSVKAVTGVANASSPKPNIIFNDKVKQYLLAWIRVRPKVTKLTWADVDNRVGLSTQLTLGLMQVVPISTFTSYWNIWRNQFYAYFNDLKKVVNQGTIDNIVANLDLMVNIADKALPTTPKTNDTLYLTKYSASTILINGVRPRNTIVAAANESVLGGRTHVSYTTLNNKMHLNHNMFFRFTTD